MSLVVEISRRVRLRASGGRRDCPVTCIPISKEKGRAVVLLSGDCVCSPRHVQRFLAMSHRLSIKIAQMGAAPFFQGRGHPAGLDATTGQQIRTPQKYPL